MIRLTNAIKFFLILFAAIIVLAGCKKDEKPQPNPIPETQPKAKLTLVSGNNQSGAYGEYLSDELTFKITAPQEKETAQYYLQFAMVQGNGIVKSDADYSKPYILPDGTAKARWQLGCNTPNQKIIAYVYATPQFYTENGKSPVPQDSVEIQATGSKPKSDWAKACGCGTLDIYNTQITTFDNKTLYLVNRELYASTDHGINWEKVKGIPNSSEIVSAQFNSKGWLYLLTKSNGVIYSRDLKNWHEINNGILDKRDPTGFMVKDDILMVSFYFDGPYITTDNGGFWQKLIVSRDSQRFSFFNKHADGSLYLFDDWGTLFRSKDTGKSWQSIKLDYGYYLSQPSGFAIGPDGNLYVGSDDAIIAQVSPLTLKGTAKRYYEWNSSSQSVSNISFYRDDVFYLVRYTPKPGIYSIKNNWGRLELGFDKTIYSYYIKPDGNFLLVGQDGLYYKN
ncbi:hypothetical protein TH53_00780 [Pedobacter lusitanus]|uniref:Uncharacterized protein n=1 Tax=Pedobacter lusitanus TaxID=1503925 RepID=A0A0D0G284_9SPHI|nr:hypothetical protein [Pedobacter lusitanus]KIO78884.1 hypothetical protein TH53_00780 [Pedobacter lusitanus]